MCVSCETYEYSGNCGPSCSDHRYRDDVSLNRLVGDDSLRLQVCFCGSVRSNEDD